MDVLGIFVFDFQIVSSIVELMGEVDPVSANVLCSGYDKVRNFFSSLVLYNFVVHLCHF